jgi:hypothetical protein
MTDFLTRLAERTLGLAPTAQPLLPSRFATDHAPLAGHTFNNTMDEMLTEGNIEVVETGSRFNTMSTLSTKIPQTGPDLLMQTRATLLQHEDERRQAGSTPSRDVGEQKYTKVLPPVSPAVPSEYPLSHLSQTESMWLKPSKEDSPANQEQLQLKVAPSIRRDVDNELSPTGQRSIPAEIRHQEISLMQSQPRPVNLGQERVEHAHVPEVRVTIGRIDVRAMLPSAPGATSTQPASARLRPALSLDDYLKQQKGGKR